MLPFGLLVCALYLQPNVVEAGLVLRNGQTQNARKSTKKHIQSGNLGINADRSAMVHKEYAMADASNTAEVIPVSSAKADAMSSYYDDYTTESTPNVFSPDSKVLVWDTKPKPGSTSKGWLTVPLDPDDSESPAIKVRVQMWFATVQPAPLGVLFTHCGGPGTKKSCPTEWAKNGWLLNKEGADNNPANPFYDVFGIDQRGIGETGPRVDCEAMSKWISGPDAQSKLESLKKKYASGSRLSVRDFTDCPCAMGDGGHPIAFGTSAAVDPAKSAEVSLHFQSLAARSKRCYEWSKWTLSGKGGKVYNFLDYVGTDRVVGDIEAFRRSVGASKLSLMGAGYGTLVGGMYATMFADRVDKLLMNSCMDPELDAVKLAKETAIGFARSARRLLQDCSKQSACPLYNDGNPFSAFESIYKKLRSSHGLSAPMAPTGNAKEGAPFRLTPGLLTSWLLRQLSDSVGSGWTTAAQVLADLADKRKHVRTNAVTTVLNEMCAPLGPDGDIFTWHYGVCIGNQVEEVDGTLLQAAVLPVDYAGRYTVSQATHMAQATYGELGEFTSAFIGYLSNMFSWPVLPQPAGTIGNPKVKAVVIGNLYDPISAYTASQAMHQAFPAGSMITWQGVGHVFQPGNSYDKIGAATCNKALIDFMKSGNLPQNGKVCLNKAPLPLMSKARNSDTDYDAGDDDDEEEEKPFFEGMPVKESGALMAQIPQCLVMILVWLLHA